MRICPCRTLLFTLLSLLLFSSAPAEAQTRMPARQVSVVTNYWDYLFPTTDTAQATFDFIDDSLLSLDLRLGVGLTNLYLGMGALSNSVGALETNVDHILANYLLGTNINGGTYVSNQWTITPASIGGMDGTNIEGAVLSGDSWTGLINRAFIDAKTSGDAWFTRTHVEDTVGPIFVYTNTPTYRTLPFYTTNGYAESGGLFAGTDVTNGGRLYFPTGGRYLIAASVGTTSQNIMVYMRVYTNSALDRRNQAVFFGTEGQGSTVGLYDIPYTNDCWVEFTGAGRTTPPYLVRIQWMSLSVFRLSEYFKEDE